MKIALKTLLKVALSLFALWHIFAIFVLPNPDSLLYRELNDSVVAYGNLFGFNTTWRFFSPNPMIRLLEYDAYTRDAEGKLTSKSGRFPDTMDKEPDREVYNRKLNSGMFMIMRQALEITIGPKLCEWNPKAETIAIFMRGRVFPTIEKSKFYTSHTQELGKVTRDPVVEIQCNDLAKTGTDEKAPE